MALPGERVEHYSVVPYNRFSRSNNLYTNSAIDILFLLPISDLFSSLTEPNTQPPLGLRSSRGLRNRQRMGKFTGKKCRLLTVMWLTALFFFVEIVVGYVTNSMALVADSFHMLSDIAALVISFLSIKVS